MQTTLLRYLDLDNREHISDSDQAPWECIVRIGLPAVLEETRPSSYLLDVRICGGIPVLGAQTARQTRTGLC